MKTGDSVKGINLDGEEVQGTVENVLNTFQIAMVRTNDDRLGITECHISNLEKI
jgi:hypothetical protein